MGKNKSASNLVNVIDFNNDRIAFISGSTTLMSISSSGAITTTGVISGSNAASASYALNAGLLNNRNSAEFTSTGSFNSYTSSNDATVTSVAGAAVSAVAGVNALAARTSSYTTTSSFNSYTASNNTTMSCVFSTATSALVGVGTLASQTGSYATTGSNTFVGGQYLSSSFNPTGFSTTASLYTDGGLRVTRDAYISGTLYLNNVTVFGTQSVAYISSSQLNIGTNLITVNTDTPSIRFGGLAVYDSGSTGLTGSILWDSQNNHWVYSNPSGSSYSGGMFISGPRTSTLGSETGTTSCMLLAGQGGDHLTSSMIYHDSTVTCIPNTLIGGSTICTTMTNTSCIGIGTTSPSQKLHIADSSNLYLRVQNTAAADVYLGAESSLGVLSISNSYPLDIRTNNVSRIWVAAAGNVGIGTTSPTTVSTYKVLEITGPNTSTGGMIRTNISDNSIIGKFYTNSTGVWVSAETSHPLILETANTERLRITSTGIACFACIVCAPRLNLRNETDRTCLLGTTQGIIHLSDGSTPSSNEVTAITFASNNIGDASSIIGNVVTNSGSKLFFGTSNSYAAGVTNTALTIDHNGNVGIGVVSPTSSTNYTSLAINGTTGSELYFKGGNTDFGYMYANSGIVVLATQIAIPLTFQTNTVERMRIASTGITCFACQVCVKEAVYVYGSFPGVKLDRAGTTAQSDINWKDAGTSVWSIGTAVQAIGSNLDFYNYTLGGNVLKLTTTGEACFKYTVCSPNFQTGANSNLSKSSIRLRSANDNKYLDFNSFNTCNVINSNYGDSDIPLILGTYFGHQTNQLFLATNCNVGIGTNTPNEKLDVRGAIQVRGESLGYATTQCVGMLDFYANTTRILSFGGNATTCGCFRFYSAAQNNAGGSDVAIINGGGAACFAGTVCAPRFVGPVTGVVTGFIQRTQTGCVMSSASSDVTVYFTSGIVISYGVNDYTVVASPNDNAAAMSSTRVVIPYNYYAGTLSTTVLASYIDSPNSHSVLAVSICKVVNSNTNCLAVRFAKSSGNVTNTYIQVTTNGMNPGND